VNDSDFYTNNEALQTNGHTDHCRSLDTQKLL